MIVAFVVLAALLVAAIGLVAVGRVTNRLAVAPPTRVFDLDEAVAWVAERLSDDVTAQLSYDDVRALLGWQVDYLESKGVAGESDHDLEALTGPIVTGEDEALAYVLGQATDAGLDVDDVEVLEVLDGGLAYLRAIGAVGTEVPAPMDPSPMDPSP